MINYLFDADMLVYRACASVERETQWDDGLWTLHADQNEAQAKVDDIVVSYLDKVCRKLKYTGRYKILMCFSDKENFRKKILSSYKLNREGKRKPLGYYAVREWVEKQYTSLCLPSLEADDVLGLQATHLKNSVIISGDKDFKSIPGKFYNFLSDTLYDISESEADYWHLFQTLIGDAADNYTGCPGIGAVTAKKLLDSEGATWETVIKAYEKKHLSQEEALTQARVARILRSGEYDFKKHQAILWVPH